MIMEKIPIERCGVMQLCSRRVESGQAGPSEVRHVGQVSISAVTIAVRTLDRGHPCQRGLRRWKQARQSGTCIEWDVGKTSEMTIDDFGENFDWALRSHATLQPQSRVWPSGTIRGRSRRSGLHTCCNHRSANTRSGKSVSDSRAAAEASAAKRNKHRTVPSENSPK